MSTLIVAFPKIEEAKAVRNLLVRKGYEVAIPCITGAQVINQADNLSDGIIICGYKLSDNMIYTELNEYKPKSFEMLLVASRNLWGDCQDNDIVCAAMPIKVNDLCSTIEMMLQAQVRRRRKLRSQPRRRSPQASPSCKTNCNFRCLCSERKRRAFKIKHSKMRAAPRRRGWHRRWA